MVMAAVEYVKPVAVLEVLHKYGMVESSAINFYSIAQLDSIDILKFVDQHFAITSLENTRESMGVVTPYAMVASVKYNNLRVARYMFKRWPNAINDKVIEQALYISFKTANGYQSRNKTYKGRLNSSFLNPYSPLKRMERIECFNYIEMESKLMSPITHRAMLANVTRIDDFNRIPARRLLDSSSSSSSINTRGTAQTPYLATQTTLTSLDYHNECIDVNMVLKALESKPLVTQLYLPPWVGNRQITINPSPLKLPETVTTLGIRRADQLDRLSSIVNPYIQHLVLYGLPVIDYSKLSNKLPSITTIRIINDNQTIMPQTPYALFSQILSSQWKINTIVIEKDFNSKYTAYYSLRTASVKGRLNSSFLSPYSPLKRMERIECFNYIEMESTLMSPITHRAMLANVTRIDDFKYIETLAMMPLLQHLTVVSQLADYSILLQYLATQTTLTSLDYRNDNIDIIKVLKILESKPLMSQLYIPPYTTYRGANVDIGPLILPTTISTIGVRSAFQLLRLSNNVNPYIQHLVLDGCDKVDYSNLSNKLPSITTIRIINDNQFSIPNPPYALFSQILSSQWKINTISIESSLKTDNQQLYFGQRKTLVSIVDDMEELKRNISTLVITKLINTSTKKKIVLSNKAL
eukprot:gene9000-10556_t